MVGTHGRPPGSTRRKVGMTSSHHAPYVLGCKHATIADTVGCDTVRWSESLKAGLNSSRSLQLAKLREVSQVFPVTHRSGSYAPRLSPLRPSRLKIRHPPKPVAHPLCGCSDRRLGWCF